ncbi:spore coat composition protein, manganese catalase family [Gottschalkia purinilytica]|uniref:Spore coat composition protein, manganese catalase family n=1 Tax=Gottschalkia purinilytica TaxID=1503 RepID=A0A0L0WAM2_GOTPU|nr:spore coat protein CotJB [Gottschalkia purinilytica]KNF08574.1 spore coat composition protein, manganese catalase family [Gottschalkia purinilytica]
MNRERKAMLKQLMELDFVLVETALYLNTHPHDEEALRLHNTFSKKSKDLTCIYESKYGPLTFKGMSRYPWQYIDDPWPWEINF